MERNAELPSGNTVPVGYSVLKIFEASRFQSSFQNAEGFRAGEQWVPRGIDIMHESWLGDFSRADISAEPGIAFENANLPAGFSEKRRASEGIYPAAHKDGVKCVGHARFA